MNLLDIAILIFVIMESANVCILYFAPDSKLGNGVAVFNAWNQLKKDENHHLFAKYMASWVAGAKLIFIALLIVIFILGSEEIKIAANVAMILSISSYFWKLHPIMKKLDANQEVTPKGYSKKLDGMIIGFILMFLAFLVIHLFQRGV